MGYGDEIMAAGQAERLWRETGQTVAICDAQDRPRLHEIWEGNPAISIEGPQRIRNAPGCRPYIAYPFSRELGQRFTGWRARDHRGSIHLTEAERRWADMTVPDWVVVINPLVKGYANPNKDWGFARWQAVVDALQSPGSVASLQGIGFVQLGPTAERQPQLRGAAPIDTPSFRLACAALARARLYVGAEGGMHHAAAALRIPAAVIFGAAACVETTGYPEHANLTSGEPCGRWLPCDHCREAMAAITVDAVVQSITDALERPCSKP